MDLRPCFVCRHTMEMHVVNGRGLVCLVAGCDHMDDKEGKPKENPKRNIEPPTPFNIMDRHKYTEKEIKLEEG